MTDELRELIVQGELKLGQHVQEMWIAERLGVSRTPVRTALNTLASEGYLVYLPNRGYFVRQFDITELMDVYEIRASLESLAARRAAERGITREQESVLMRCVEEGDRILRKGYFADDDLLPYRRMNVGIHEGIIQATGNARLAETIRQNNNLPLVSDRVILWQNFDVLKRSHDDHHRVITAIIARDVWRASAIMYEHVYYAGLALRDHLRTQDGLSLLIDPSKLAAVTADISSGDNPK
ncbi:GntR family transcriptional regulator [Pararobbsia silviterrae]|uniref:GntR family transcriptional regulator n=1 Tax=Pararobbsia silviterrae TaxID=1792498 RepID=UPI0013144A4A|nr:GntR family transcriptional regulator [Pararobbsia silviterrae]